jgi:5-methylcytosine-specific restriction endonuclease McrA
MSKQSMKRCPKCKHVYRTDRHLCPTCIGALPVRRDTRVQDGKRAPSRVRYPTLYWTNRKIVLADNPMCVYCRVNVATTADHIVAISRGGTHDLENLAPACKPCNDSKKDTPVAEWWRRR